MISQKQLIDAFVHLGAFMHLIEQREKGNEQLIKIHELIEREQHYNGWFVPKNIYQAIGALASLLDNKKLEDWVSSYNYALSPQKVGIIMAGNIPLVGFHDFLAVLISGHKAVIKLSSDDSRLLPVLISELINYNSALKDRIQVVEQLKEVDAVIATGSNNSALYFEKYFGKYPHIIRKNRTSIAVVDGTETTEELNLLGTDIFSYFGLGCRNISKVFIPKDFDLDRLFNGVYSFADIVNHKKYANNYDYYKAIYLMNQEKILENGFLLTKETSELHSPLAVLYYQRYNDLKEVTDFIAEHQEQLQVVVGKGFVPFGCAQNPALTDYADGVDTLSFLEKLG